MIQEYFDAFNTLNLNTRTIRNGVGLDLIGTIANLKQHQQQININGNQLLNDQAQRLFLQQQQQQTIRNNSNSSGSSSSAPIVNDDSSLLQESAQLFFNPQSQQQQFSRDAALRQSTSAFKPFMRISNDQNNNDSAINNLAQSYQQQPYSLPQNQYDKINHHQSFQSTTKLKTGLCSANDSAGQYAHTYESLDTLELPNRRQIVHLSVNARNYNGKLINSNCLEAINQISLSPNKQHITGELIANEMGNFNISTSTTSSSASSTSSGNSSTHPLIKTLPNQHQRVDFSNINLKLNEAQLILPSMHTINQSQANPQLGNILLSTNNNLNSVGTWSPDSAYYSSIPTLNNYNNFNLQHAQKMPVNSQLLNKQFINLNSPINNDNFKSHLV
jgi:hypothetical protein